jgi:hypothetical protein
VAAHFRPGDCVIYRKPKLSAHPGRHAQDIRPAPNGDSYAYCVPKLYRVARAVTDYATPVGSGTVARTKRIPVERRAEAAVIAWMRHQTTGYDGMVVPKVKGKRREVRRTVAQRSKELLERDRRGEAAPNGCPLKKALAGQAGSS